jgi:hypothetical protein
LSRVWVELSVSSTDLPLVREGQSVRVSTRTHRNCDSQGRIREPCSTRRRDRARRCCAR